MKELSIEEKAKRYDEALKVIKGCNHDENGFVTIYPNEIFPELKESEESEDEKIKQEIIDYLSTVDDKELIPYEYWIAWLEKQGEQKSDTNFSDLRTWKYIVDAVWTEKEGIGQYLDSPFTEEVAKKLQKRFGNIGQNLANSVKTCKDEQNSVWSEEDEQNLNEALSYIKDDALKEFIKSLRPQKQWKPSKKQMEYLLKYGEQNNYDGAILTSLYNELKQL